MSSLTKKATGGLIWSILNNIGVYGISFIVGIILARLLSPEEFGLIGMITVFITLLSVFVDSGFKTALIRKTDCNQTDYSTVFFFNVAISIFLYLILFFSSEYISFFYNEPELNSLLKVLGIVIVIEAFSLIQTTILTKQLNFKLQALISIIAGALSGIIGILLAYMGFGVWSLVFYSLINKLLLSAFYWLFNKWRPSFVFSFISFREFFAFGSKLMLANFINTLQKNLSY
ncbi:MAG TPA: oligosaccharide flippase family protein, partial [Gallicola sp.]|nr:oligosaccharide flippase family protein [Gallicola sp.]